MSGSRQQHTPDRGDIVFTNFSPQSGSEMAGDHPSLVLSTARFSVSTGWMVACPITSKVKGSPFEVVLPAQLKTKGCVVASEIRTLDYLIRGVRFIEKAPTTLLQDVQTIAVAVISK
jgi:mRNA interferase MazF